MLKIVFLIVKFFKKEHFVRSGNETRNIGYGNSFDYEEIEKAYLRVINMLYSVNSKKHKSMITTDFCHISVFVIQS